MINLRYHIVSIVAVFLALGIGTALGGTLLDRYTVDLLNNSISSAEARIKSTEKENRRLDALMDDAQARDEALINSSSALLGDQLLNTTVLMITAPGVDVDVANDLGATLAAAGADVRGILALRDPMTFPDDRVSDGLAEAVGEDPGDVGAVRRAVLEQLEESLVAAGRPAPAPGDEPEPGSTGPTTTMPGDPAPGPTTTVPPTTAPAPSTTEPGSDPAAPTTTVVPSDDDGGQLADGSQPEIIDALLASDYVRLVRPDGEDDTRPVLEQAGYRFVFVTDPSADAAANEILIDVLSADNGERALPAVVVSATSPKTDPSEERTPSAVDRVRASSRLAERFSTVDDVETFSGLMAMVLATQDLDRPVVGHYGQGDGAVAVLPPPR